MSEELMEPSELFDASNHLDQQSGVNAPAALAEQQQPESLPHDTDVLAAHVSTSSMESGNGENEIHHQQQQEQHQPQQQSMEPEATEAEPLPLEHQQEITSKESPPANGTDNGTSNGVIELLEDDDDIIDFSLFPPSGLSTTTTLQPPLAEPSTPPQSTLSKRQLPSPSADTNEPAHSRLRTEPQNTTMSGGLAPPPYPLVASAAIPPPNPNPAAQLSAQYRQHNLPDWMLQQAAHMQHTQQSYSTAVTPSPLVGGRPYLQSQPKQQQRHSTNILVPTYLGLKQGFVPTWQKILPRGFLAAKREKEQMVSTKKRYMLSVLNASEFTITGASPDNYSEPSSVKGLGLRKFVKQITQNKAVFENDAEAVEGGKWRIPIGAYQAFFHHVQSIPNTLVQGIPAQHLNCAMLARQRLEKGYPSVKKLLHYGVPPKVANTLAPFQRGGVDFLKERNGRALIADEMGLGKTIQAIASIAMYHDDWPVLVLSPSGARYHWQNEFLNWLGEDKKDDSKLHDFTNGEIEEEEEAEVLVGKPKIPMKPLLESQVHVLTSGNQDILPSSDTKVVIMSYGLGPKMAEDRKLVPGMFNCAIVDESHMMKNKNSKRTKELMPILQQTKRCILLSGTPAFARPMELWPQMKILGTAADDWFTSESDFVSKYVKGSRQRRAELHTLLTGTFMIRRMKHVILKQLPAKVREQAVVNILDPDTRKMFREFLNALHKGKGALARIAQRHMIEYDDAPSELELKPKAPTAAQEGAPVPPTRSIEELTAQVKHEVDAYFQQRSHEINQILQTQQMTMQMDPTYVEHTRMEAMTTLRGETEQMYHTRLNTLKMQNTAAADQQVPEEAAPPSRKAMLIQMYKKTGQTKIPLVIEMLKLWLKNPAKGKLCIFAHHISVLNEVGEGAGLSNASGSNSKFIRIDGSTNPKQRQEQINRFQTDPTVRIALLGITAAGVAVTLTAASTVWFAELFWTPALLIQAEDRCHRIGQQAKVSCLYIVAKGTLDEILWKHVEKKFRDLGEFVEGKEKMKMVVHKVYKGVKELNKSLEMEAIDYDDDIEELDGMEDADEIEGELQSDFEEFEREEQEMLVIDEGDDDDGDGDAKPKSATISIDDPKDTVGSNENEAICLDSDDEDDKPNVRKSLMEAGLKNDREFPALKLYKIRFPGPSCGIEIALFKGRVVVKNISNQLVKDRPKVGDIMIACRDQEVVSNVKLQALLNHIAQLIQQDGSIEFLFAEDEEFREYYLARKDDPEENVVQQPKTSVIRRLIPSLPSYVIKFADPGACGFSVAQCQSELVVASIEDESSVQDVVGDGKLRVGDILVGINNAEFSPGFSSEKLKMVLEKLQQQDEGRGVSIKFAAVHDILRKQIIEHMMESKRRKQARIVPPTPAESHQPAADNGGGDPEVIDLLDD